jgi:quercetin dioxygenase-like cupin family protein
MRQFEVTPGGRTPFHDHPWEHEVFVLSGAGQVRLDADEVQIVAGDAVLISPCEMHSFECVGDEALTFLCLIPVAEACCR